MQSEKSDPQISNSGEEETDIKPNVTAGGDSETNKKSTVTKNDEHSNSKESGGGSNRSRSRSTRRRRSRSPINRSREDQSSSSKTHLRVYVANIPFDVKWGELKDFFREKVGRVRFCQLFEDEDGKPRGCGLVEFEDSASVQKAIETLNRYNFKGRELVVREDLDIERDRCGRLLLNRDRNGRHRDRRRDPDHGGYGNSHYSNGANHGAPCEPYNTFGLSPQFLNSLGIKGPLNNRVFVANLDYKVSERKLEDIFALAGNVIRVRLYCDHEGKSKGFGVVEFEHPVEAVQAISMFNNQKLYDRILSVRLDKFDPDEVADDGLPSKLPKGLEGIGKGLGVGGKPLNIAKCSVAPQMPVGSMVNPMPAPSGPMPVTAPPQASVTPQTASAALNVLSNLASLPNLTQSLAQLSNNVAPASTSMTAGPVPNIGGGYSSGSEMGSLPQASSSVTSPPYATSSAYATNYSSAVPQAPPPSLTHGNGTTQAPYGSNQMMTHGNYGGISQAPAPPPMYSTAPPATHSGSISSYPAYEKRSESYRSPTNGIDTVFVQNLPINFSWQNLRDRFSEVGEVRFAELKGHGTALVRFATDRDAQRAVERMNGFRIENRAIDVNFYY